MNTTARSRTDLEERAKRVGYSIDGQTDIEAEQFLSRCEEDQAREAWQESCLGPAQNADRPTDSRSVVEDKTWKDL